jgi:pectinesterase
MYGGFFLDVHGRKAGRPGLWNDAAAYVPIKRDLGTGRDVFHIGSTLGLGGVFLRRDGNVYQPPANVPTYAHKPSPEMVPHYRVLAQGPLRAVVEATLDNWELDGDVIRLRARYSIDQGESFVRCHVEAVPVKVAAGREYELGFGIRDLPAGSVSSTPGQLIVTGQQNPRDGKIGLAAYFKANGYSSVAAVRTSDGSNRALIHKEKLRPGQTVELDYAAAGAWSGSGIENIADALSQLQSAVDSRAETGELTFSRTPHPDKVDAEAQ